MLLSLCHLLVLSSYHGFFVLAMSQFSCFISSGRLTVKWHPKFVSLNNLPIRVLLEAQIDRKWWRVCLGQTESNFGLDVSKWGTDCPDMEYNRQVYFGHRRLACRGTEKQTLTLTTAVEQWLRFCATNRKVAGSIPAGVIGIFHWHRILPIALWPWGRLSL